jgi:Tat protein secretion system quality control protein TatD with DNase activity
MISITFSMQKDYENSEEYIPQSVEYVTKIIDINGEDTREIIVHHFEQFLKSLDI